MIEGVIVFVTGSLFGGWCVYTTNKGENPIKVVIRLVGKTFEVFKRTVKYTVKFVKKEEGKV